MAQRRPRLYIGWCLRGDQSGGWHILSSDHDRRSCGRTMDYVRFVSTYEVLLCMGYYGLTGGTSTSVAALGKDGLCIKFLINFNGTVVDVFSVVVYY